MSAKVVFIAPDKKLADMAAEVSARMGGDVEVMCGSMREGLRLAREAQGRGAAIIISRGGTGELIKRSLKLPVIIMETTSYDVIRSVSNAVKISKHIGIVGFQSLIISYEKVINIIESVFSAHIATSIIDSGTDLRQTIAQMSASGTEVFIGGHMVATECTGLSYPCTLIETSKETIADTILQAKNYLELRRNEKKQLELFNSIIDFAYDGILAVDNKGAITVFNPIIQKITGRSAEEVIGLRVDDVVENTRMVNVLESRTAELGEIQKIGSTTIVTNRVPIIVDDEVMGVVATFQEIERIQRTEASIRRKLQAKGHTAKFRFADIKGESAVLRATVEKARLYARVDSTVLILGESGTGKELFAQSIHNESARADKPFVAVNCAALPENLLESELFGYVEGAFTGAKKGGKAGLFELAHNGTIFLDEISEMRPNLQVRLLRVLQEKEVTRLGADYVIPVDIRIIAASNRDLGAYVRDGFFREDLFYRLSVLALTLPPLRERGGDIPEIAVYFINKKSHELGARIKSISPDALNCLTRYDWPGNVRQLENVIERCVVLCKDGEISERLVYEALNIPRAGTPTLTPEAPRFLRSGALRDLESETILRVLEECGGQKKQAAQQLGISTTTLWRRLKEINGNN